MDKHNFTLEFAVNEKRMQNDDDRIIDRYVSQDPFDFIRTTARQLGIETKFEYSEWGMPNLLGGSLQRQTSDGIRELFIEIVQKDSENEATYDWDRVQKSFDNSTEYLRLGGKELSFENSTFSDLGKSARDFHMKVSYSKYDIDADILLTAEIGYFRKNAFALKLLDQQIDAGYEHIAKIAGSDYRPYIHRMLELMAEVPKEQWHDPAIYGKIKIESSYQGISQDPISFLHEASNRLGLELTLSQGNLLQNSKKSRLVANRGLLHKWQFTTRAQDGVDHKFSLLLYPNDVKESDLQSLQAYIDGKEHDGVSFQDFDILKHTLNDMGKFGQLLRTTFYYAMFKDTDDLVSRYLRIHSDRDGNFQYGGVDGRLTRKIENPFKGIQKEDYREMLWKMISLYAGKPDAPWISQSTNLESWYDARLSDSGSQSTGRTEFIASIDALLTRFFSGKELDALKSQMHKRLSLRSYHSLPKLNLGISVLPSPNLAQKIEQADQLVAYISMLGIMSEEEAQELLMQKVSTALVHDPLFQKSDQHALQLIRTFEGR